MTVSKRGFALALALVFLAVGIQYGFKILDLRDGKQDRSAILRWRDQILSLDGGENIYQRFTYPNPPIMAIMLRPLMELPPTAGAFVWFFAKSVLAYLSLLAAFRLVESPGMPFPSWAKALTVLLVLRPVLGDLSHGNVNLLILALVMGCLAAYQQEWDLSAGLLLGLAIACKVTPALFVGYFLWKRAWRLLFGCAIGLGLFFFVVPSLFLGWSNNWDLLQSWFQQMVTPYVMGGIVTSERANQSLPGVLFRLLTHSPSELAYEGNAAVPAEFHNFLSLNTKWIGWIVKGCMAGFVGMVVWLCRASTTPPRVGWRLAAEYSLVLIGMLMFSERTWKHHCVTLMLPAAVLAYRLATDPARRPLVLGAILFSQLAMATTSHGLFPEQFAELAQVYGAYLVGFCIYLAATAALLAPPRPSAEASSALPHRVAA